MTAANKLEMVPNETTTPQNADYLDGHVTLTWDRPSTLETAGQVFAVMVAVSVGMAIGTVIVGAAVRVFDRLTTKEKKPTEKAPKSKAKVH